MPFRHIQFSRKIIHDILVFVFLISAVPAFADDQQPAKSTHQFILKQFYTDVSYLLHEPSFYAVIGGLSVGPSIFHTAFKREDPEFTEMLGNSKFSDDVFEAGEVIGDGIVPFSVSFASWGIGKLNKSRTLQDFGTDMFRAQAINGLITGVMKKTINRTRPDGGPYSYPSGHTSTSFAAAGVVYKHFGKTWGIPAFAVATYVGFSRLQENKHYLSDVIAGGIIGSYVSLTLSKRDTRGSSLSLSPFNNGDAKGLELSLKF